MWTIDKEPIGKLIKWVDDSKLVLPQFQRESVWGKANWVPFITTLLLGRPTGTLLLFRSSDPDLLSPKGLDGGPQPIPERIEWLLLDGQQRTTTLYKAMHAGFGPKGRIKKIVIDVKSAISDGVLEEDHVKVVDANRVSDYTSMAVQGLIATEYLRSVADFENWKSAFVSAQFDGDAGAFAEAVTQAIPGLLTLLQYEFPVLKIESETPLDVVADIFEGMNRRGQALNKFDLMVARLFRELSDGQRYDLRATWSDLLDNSPNLTQLGIGVEDGLLPLQLIAKEVSRHPGHGKVKGLTTAHVLELPPGQVHGDPIDFSVVPGLSLEIAASALEKAAKFLRSKCGVVTASLLPQEGMLVPLADQFLGEELWGSRLSDSQLKRWFFATGLGIEFYGGVNSYMAKHCDALKEWLTTGIEPAVCGDLSKEAVQDLDLTMQFTREGNILGRTVMSLLVLEGAKDWEVGQSKVSHHDEVDYHHMIPEQRLKELGIGDGARKPIALMTPIRSSTNRALGRMNPADVISILAGSAASVLASHQVNPSLLTAAYESEESLKTFLAHREQSLKNFVTSSLGLV